jgi:hypothetical protein
MYLQEVEWGGMECIVQAQDRYRWQTLTNAVTNLQVPLLNWGICLLGEDLLVFRKISGQCNSFEIVM